MISVHSFRHCNKNHWRPCVRVPIARMLRKRWVRNTGEFGHEKSIYEASLAMKAHWRA